MLPSTWGLFDAMLLRSVTMLADCTFSELDLDVRLGARSRETRVDIYYV
jgi:hypothetical protein